MDVYTPGCIYGGTVTEKHQNVPRKTNSIHADPSIDAVQDQLLETPAENLSDQSDLLSQIFDVISFLCS
jgi:hypothetical protein